MFYISDPDTSAESLTITVVTTPVNGDLVKVIKGQDVKIKAGDNVTVSDMLLGKLWFKHKAGKSERGMQIFNKIYFLCVILLKI